MVRWGERAGRPLLGRGRGATVGRWKDRCPARAMGQREPRRGVVCGRQASAGLAIPCSHWSPCGRKESGAQPTARGRPLGALAMPASSIPPPYFQYRRQFGAHAGRTDTGGAHGSSVLLLPTPPPACTTAPPRFLAVTIAHAGARRSPFQPSHPSLNLLACPPPAGCPPCLRGHVSTSPGRRSGSRGRRPRR